MRPYLLASLLAVLLPAPASAQLDPGGGLRDPAGGLRHSPLADAPQVDAGAARIEALTANLAALAERMAEAVAGLEASAQARPVAPGPETGDEARKQYQGALASWQLERQDLVAELETLQAQSVARERELTRLTAKAPSSQLQAEAKRAIEAARRERQRAQAALAGSGA